MVIQVGHLKSLIYIYFCNVVLKEKIICFLFCSWCKYIPSPAFSPATFSHLQEKFQTCWNTHTHQNKAKQNKIKQNKKKQEAESYSLKKIKTTTKTQQMQIQRELLNALIFFLHCITSITKLHCLCCKDLFALAR